MHSSGEMAVIVNLNYLQRSQGASTNDFPDTVSMSLLTEILPATTVGKSVLEYSVPY